MYYGFIVSGMLVGDEGKGSVTDYLASLIDAKYNVRYNGGSQAAHTVKNNSHTHKFSQLGSAFMNGTNTFLSSNTIVNPFNLITEASIYAKETSSSINRILKRVYIDGESSVVTPYHSFITKINELARENLLGTTGSGVSEVKRIRDKLGINITINDLFKMDDEVKGKIHELQDYTSHVLSSKRSLIDDNKFKKYIDKDDIENLTTYHNRNFLIDCYKNLIDSGLINRASFQDCYDEGNIVFEGSQGVMLDKDYGIKPNVTGCDTTNRFAYKMANLVKVNPISVGCVSVYNSRHGAGPLPTIDEYLNIIIYDENQVPSYFQGKPIYGWLDLVILRYTLGINKTDELFLTMIDRYSGIEKIKVCNSYRYHGVLDDEFKDSFDYYIDGKDIIIMNIKNNNNLKYYLSRIEPIYKVIDGYSFDREKIKDINDFPDEVFNYINYIEKNCGKKIKHLSFGPDRKHKMEVQK